MRILNEGAQLAGRYSLSRRLAATNGIEVWLADDRQADAKIALKILVADDDNGQRAARLKREWQISSRLMHANIIRVFEYHDDPEGPFFGLQYLGDADVGNMATASPAESLGVIGMIADALRYAHGKGTVHRDVKAANVLLDAGGVPYLIDYGVAATAGSADMADSGTEIAMSPQQRAGDAAEPSDDVFALGVLTHELLTGLPPGGSDRQQLGSTATNGEPLPTAVLDLVRDMLAIDAGSRPDAESVVARLEAAGFPRRPAPRRFAGSSATSDVLPAVERVQVTRHSAASGAAPKADRAEAKGIGPRALYGGLGAAAIVFLGVIFVLPKLVERDPGIVSETPTMANPAEVAEPLIPDEEAIDPEDAAALKLATDEALGDLLSQLERLRYRGIERWGGQGYLDAVDVSEVGDRAYIARNYRLAGEQYRRASEMLAPFFDRIDGVFEQTLADAKAAIEAGDSSEAVRLYDLAVAITPGNREAEAGLQRATNLADVLSLVQQGERYESDLELDAAKLAFERALEIDSVWAPAADGLARVQIAIKNFSFEQRMTEGFDALMSGDLASARAAFNAAKTLNPASREPADGLMQVDQEARLREIQRLESVAAGHDMAEEWETSIGVYEDILNIDPDLQFAQTGLGNARSRAGLHRQLQAYIDQPDDLSDQANMQSATRLLLDITRIDPMGPRLNDQKNELSRLLKRASTPLAVQFVSDNLTNVSVFKIGRLGNFTSQQIELRPGNYVAVGIRPGYRDVRIEFRVAPEIDMQPVVVRCEEPI